MQARAAIHSRQRIRDNEHAAIGMKLTRVKSF